ncbi:MAG: hypothetical protein V3U85_10275 [Hyphomicrobium sp.]
MVVTSLRRPYKHGSRHSEPYDVLVTAADIRRWDLDQIGEAEDFSRWLQTALGLGVLLEPEWMTPEQVAARGGVDAIPPHIHAQLNLDPGDLGFERVA